MLFIIINSIITYFAIGYGLYLWRAYKTISEDLTEDDLLFVEKDFAFCEIIFWPFSLFAIFAIKLKRCLIDGTWDALEKKYKKPKTESAISTNPCFCVDGSVFYFHDGEWLEVHYDR